MKYPLIWLLKAYRALISPLYGQVCKYYPSCSAYALEAVTVHGAARGSWLAGRRLLSCHPWSLGGYDPVPGTPAAAAWAAEQAAKAAGHTHDDCCGSASASTIPASDQAA
jgi:hypothetical protein